MFNDIVLASHAIWPLAESAGTPKDPWIVIVNDGLPVIDRPPAGVVSVVVGVAMSVARSAPGRR
jgi:hypothetical protein